MHADDNQIRHIYSNPNLKCRRAQSMSANSQGQIERRDAFPRACRLNTCQRQIRRNSSASNLSLQSHITPHQLPACSSVPQARPSNRVNNTTTTCACAPCSTVLQAPSSSNSTSLGNAAPAAGNPNMPMQTNNAESMVAIYNCSNHHVCHKAMSKQASRLPNATNTSQHTWKEQ